MKQEIKNDQTWFDTYLGGYRWYRKLRGGHWYCHQFTKDAEYLSFPEGGTWWARYGDLNRYSKVICCEIYLVRA